MRLRALRPQTVLPPLPSPNQTTTAPTRLLGRTSNMPSCVILFHRFCLCCSCRCLARLQNSCRNATRSSHSVSPGAWLFSEWNNCTWSNTQQRNMQAERQQQAHTERHRLRHEVQAAGAAASTASCMLLNNTTLHLRWM